MFRPAAYATLSVVSDDEATLDEQLAAAVADCERLGEAWLEARARGDVNAALRLDREGVEADKVSRRIERKLRKRERHVQPFAAVHEAARING